MSGTDVVADGRIIAAECSAPFNMTADPVKAFMERMQKADINRGVMLQGDLVDQVKKIVEADCPVSDDVKTALQHVEDNPGKFGIKDTALIGTDYENIKPAAPTVVATIGVRG